MVKRMKIMKITNGLYILGRIVIVVPNTRQSQAKDKSIIICQVKVF